MSAKLELSSVLNWCAWTTDKKYVCREAIDILPKDLQTLYTY